MCEEHRNIVIPDRKLHFGQLFTFFGPQQSVSGFGFGNFLKIKMISDV